MNLVLFVIYKIQFEQAIHILLGTCCMYYLT